MSSDLVVLVAPPTGGLRAVVNHLADWAAAGVVGEFVVVTDAGDGRPLGPTGYWVDSSGSRPEPVSTLVARLNPSRVRVVLLSTPLAGMPATPGVAAAARLVQELSDAGGSAQQGAPQRRVTRRGRRPRPSSSRDGTTCSSRRRTPPARAPPGSTSPGLSLDEPPRYAAPVVAGLAGLFTGLPTSALDTEPVPPGQVVRSARAYFAALDAGEVEGQLRTTASTSTKASRSLPRAAPREQCTHRERHQGRVRHGPGRVGAQCPHFPRGSASAADRGGSRDRCPAGPEDDVLLPLGHPARGTRGMVALGGGGGQGPDRDLGEPRGLR